MTITATIYNALFKKTSTFALTAIVGAFVFEACINNAADAVFNSINRGKLWDHIKDNYVKEAEAEEPPPAKKC